MTELEKFDRYLAELNSTSIGRRSFLALVPALLAACATTSQHRHREGNNVQTSLSVEDEKKMTAEVLPEMHKDYPSLQNIEAQRYISSLGKKITLANGLEGKPYQYNFTVVGVNQVNAFALPAGTIFVTAPLIAMADSEAELAGVIGHEVGHVKARHAAQRMDRAKQEQSKSWMYGAGGGLLGGAVGFGLGKLLCPKEDKSCLVKATGMGAAAGVGGGLLIQKYYFMANSREDEMEADRIGFKTSVAAGYDKAEVGRFYEKLLQMEKNSKQKNVPILGSLNDAISTHPPSDERVKQMGELVATTPNQGKKITSTREFDQIKAIAVRWTKERS